MTTLIQDAPAGRPSTGATPMADIRTILTHVRSGEADLPRLRCAAALARKLGATLVGLGSEMVPPLAATDPTGLMQAEWYAAMEERVHGELERARQLFANETAGQDAQWICVHDLPAEAIARWSRSADLILAGGHPLRDDDRYRSADAAEVVLRAGRPVLVAPPAGGELEARAIVVAWKDTREARRALADALPFLRTAEAVLLLEVCGPDQAAAAEARTADVVAGLRRHAIVAEPRVVVASSDRVATELNLAAQSLGADLIVAGGYGHSRLGEWMFGGVTRDLLQEPQRFVLLSH